MINDCVLGYLTIIETLNDVITYKGTKMLKEIDKTKNNKSIISH